MFNLQGSEIIIVLLLALVVLGPEKLPDAMRKMGQAYAELKKMSSGFQNEFRSVMDEPMREIRDTANLLRDSADFTKLQAGERDEKPKSAEMASAEMASAHANDASADDAPRFEAPTEDTAGPGLAADSRPAPFSDEPQASQRPTSTEIPAPPPPFTGMSSTMPAGRSSSDDGVTDDGVTEDDGGVGEVSGDVSQGASGDDEPISRSTAQGDGDGAGLADGLGTDTPAADHASTDDIIDDENDDESDID